MASDEFVLYDLRVVVESVGEQCTCDMSVGDSFEVRGGKLHLPDGQPFCLYALQSAIPLLPAKQRPLQPADWMATDARITCPDPYCRLILRIDRIRPHTFRHGDTSAVEMPSEGYESSQL
ncbi:MAG: TIGR04076 family protein [Anaerolineae bacterium]